MKTSTLSVLSNKVKIKMWYEENEPHHKPHIHARYGNEKSSKVYEEVFDLNGKSLEGRLPRDRRKLVIKWIKLYKEELKQNWQLTLDGEHCQSIQSI